jgi:hypothetical protein
MNIAGKILEIFDAQQVSDTFKKREFIIEYAENPQYPELLKFELIQDKCSLLDSYNVGDQVDVHFNLKGRKWSKDGKDMYFNSLQAWRVETVASSPEASSAPAAETPSEPGWLSESNDGGDLPF